MNIEIYAPNPFDDVRRKLDLGGTACYETPFAISISLDGTTSGDEISHSLIGDYNNMPMFADETFDEASGSCYLEEKPNFRELYRVLVPGAKAYIKSCGEFFAPPATVYKYVEEAGFEIVEYPVFVYEEDGSYYPDNPLVIRKKE